MTKYIKDVALDAGLEEELVYSRSSDLELLQRQNPAGHTMDHEGYGMKLRADDQEGVITDEIYLAKNRAEVEKLCNHIANDVDTVAYGVPSNGVLQYLTSIFNFKPIEQLLQTKASRVLTSDWQQGQFGTTNVYVPTTQVMGKSAAYADYSGAGQSSVNFNWVERQAVSLQQTLQYGDMTVARFGQGKIDYVAQLRSAMTNLIALDINKINFRGYAGMRIFGLLNDPSLRTVLVAPASAANPSSGQWFYKTYLEIADDIQSMFQDIITVAGGNADFSTVPCKLGVPPAVYTFLTKQNELGTQTIAGYLKIVYPNMDVVQVQDYQGTGTPVGSDVPNYAQLIYDNLAGQTVAYNVFSSLYNSHGVVRQTSSYEEKVSYTISGAFIAAPIGVSTMSGI